jgi:hypothetical protein
MNIFTHQLPLRIGLLSATLVWFDLAIALWSQGRALGSPVVLIGCFICWSVGIMTGVMALLRHVPKPAERLILVAAIGIGMMIFAANQINERYNAIARTDNEMIGRYALEALKRGENPYTWNFTDIVRVYRDYGLYQTPFLDGSTQNRLTYPILPVLTLGLFDSIGLGSARLINLIALVLALMGIYIGFPKQYRVIRPLVFVILFIFNPFFHLAVGGSQDIVWCAALIGMIALWNRPLPRALLFGIAVGFRQQAWFLAPFLMVLVWNTPGTCKQRLQRITTFAGITLMLFLIPNMPFILADPLNWAKGALEPSYAAFNVYSQGLGGVSAYTNLPLPRDFYTVLQVIFYLSALWITARHPKTIGSAYWFVPGLFFWLLYRGLMNYWVFWWIPALFAVIRLPHIHPNQSYSPKVTLRGLAASGGVIVVVLVYFLIQPTPFRVTLRYPLLTVYDSEEVGQIELDLTNQSQQLVYPRFAVQRDSFQQSLPWTILYGSESLLPGETGRYIISSEGRAGRLLPINRAGQLIITDAHGDYQLRAVVQLPTAIATDSTGTLRNTTYQFWSIGSAVPTHWKPNFTPGFNAQFTTETHDGQIALRAVLQNRIADLSPQIPSPPHLTLSQWTSFPGQLTVWVYPTRSLAPNRPTVYGIELDDGITRIRVLYGAAQNEIVRDSSSQIVVYQSTPLNQWTPQTIDFTALYRQFDRPLPALRVTTQTRVEMLTRPVKLSWIIGDSSEINTLDTEWWIGRIEQPISPNSALDAVKSMTEHPDLYYILIGNRALEQRETQTALQAYQKALTYNPRNPDIYVGLARTSLSLNDLKKSVQFYQLALTYGIQDGSQRKQVLQMLKFLHNEISSNMCCF